MPKYPIKHALRDALDALSFDASRGITVISAENREAIEALKGRVSQSMIDAGYTLPFQIKIDLIDEGEFIQFTAQTGVDKAVISIRVEDTDGKILVYIDTDGDGK